MSSRRFFLWLGVCSPIALSMRQNRYEVGDLVELVELPLIFPAVRPDLAEINRRYRLCFGKTSRVIYIGDDGRPELDVSEHVAPMALPDPVSGKLLGYTMAFEPGCLALVKRGVPFQRPEWAM
jgi:hypothetical protein